jgi:N-acetylglucosaminyldiphosphoundecaprenol N-acetyl-beta-D-mannosaminyltransferase
MSGNGEIFNKLLFHENDVISLVEKSVQQPQTFLLTYFNQFCFNVYIKDKEYKKLIDNFFHVYKDGIGIYRALKLLKKHNLDKFNASDLNLKLLQLFSRLNLKIFVVGGNFQKAQLNEKFISLGASLAGYENGFFDPKGLTSVAGKIKNSGAEIIFLGMGVPLQEKVAVELTKYLENSKIICVGNFFEFLTGNIKRAPQYLRNSGFEWVYRLSKEPKRLWKRYIIGIPVFVYHILKIKFGKEHTVEK